MPQRLKRFGLAILWAALSVALVGLLANGAWANVVGTGAQNFNPIPSGVDFITVHSSEPLAPGLINFGAYMNYAINSLPYWDSAPQGRLSFNDTLLSMDLNVGVGLAPNWEAGMSLPSVLRQTVSDDPTMRGQFSATGLTEVRLLTKYRVWGDAEGGVAVIGSTNLNLTRNNPYMGIGAGPTWNLEGAWDKTFGRFAVGANVGYRFASPGTAIPGSFITPTGKQFIASAAASTRFASLNTKLVAEVFGALPIDRSVSGDRSASALEFLAGIKHDATHEVAFHAGLGSELVHGVASPDWRVYAGVNYTIGPVFAKPGNVERRGTDRLITRNVHFRFDSDEMVGEYVPVLAEVAEILAHESFSKIVVEGHTDSIGSDEYNLALSQRRADAIRRYLINVHKIAESKVDGVGKGEFEPIADNGNFQGRSLNRRVEFKMVK